MNSSLLTDFMSLLVNGNVGEFVGSDPFQLMDFPAIIEIKNCAQLVDLCGFCEQERVARHLYSEGSHKVISDWYSYFA